MNTFIRAFFVAACCMLLLGACSSETKSVKEGRKLYQMYFRHILKDPDSFKLYNEKHDNGTYIVEWEIDYGAKNSLGGMTRETLHFETRHMDYDRYCLDIEGYRYYEEDLK